MVDLALSYFAYADDARARLINDRVVWNSPPHTLLSRSALSYSMPCPCPLRRYLCCSATLCPGLDLSLIHVLHPYTRARAPAQAIDDSMTVKFTVMRPAAPRGMRIRTTTLNRPSTGGSLGFVVATYDDGAVIVDGSFVIRHVPINTQHAPQYSACRLSS